MFPTALPVPRTNYVCLFHQNTTHVGYAGPFKGATFLLKQNIKTVKEKKMITQYRLFLVIWTGQLLSRMGSGMSAFALGVYLLHQTGSTAVYSLLLFAAFFPPILLSPLGGVLADRMDRRGLMIFGDLGSALGILFVALIIWTFKEGTGEGLYYWPVYAGVVVSSLFTAFHSPAFKASVSDLLKEKDYAKASGLIQLAEASRYLLAPVLAAFLMSHFSLPVVLLIDIGTYLLAMVTTVLARKALKASKGGAVISTEGAITNCKEGTPGTMGVGALLAGSFKDLKDGFRYIRSRRALISLLRLTTFVTFCTGVLQTLFAPILLSLSDTKTLGIVQSVSASGMLVTSLLIGLVGGRNGQERILGASLIFLAVFTIGIGVSGTVLLFGVFAFGLYASLPFVNTSLEVLFRERVDNCMQGRAWSFISFFSQLGMLSAFLVTGVLSDHVFGPLLLESGVWANTLGRVVGTGPSRGSGFMVVLVGTAMLVVLFLQKYGRIVHLRKIS